MISQTDLSKLGTFALLLISSVDYRGVLNVTDGAVPYSEQYLCLNLLGGYILI